MTDRSDRPSPPTPPPARPPSERRRPPPPPSRPKQAQSAASDEMRAWIDSLQAQQKSIGHRNRWLSVFLGVGLLLLLLILGWVYQTSVRSYAVLRDVQIARHPANQGRIRVSFEVVHPGKVYLSRESGGALTEVIDYYSTAGDQRRDWSWVYQPGEEIRVGLLYRVALWRRGQQQSFPTSKKADIVVLMDTTGSMSPSIATLKERCVQFSEALNQRQLAHRFALVGFGDTREGQWIDPYEFTDDVESFRQRVGDIRRFDGGDPAESALDAIETALALPFEEGAIRRLYLVTDATFHEPAASGATRADIEQKLNDAKVMLNVFTREEFRPEYEALAGESGKVLTIEEFGQVLAEGRILED